jgi:hypothetical protein
MRRPGSRWCRRWAPVTAFTPWTSAVAG